MSTTKFNITQKAGLWNAYDQKCFYCNKILEWDDVHIDHIVPESLEIETDNFKVTCQEYELGEEFNVNHFYNLVPTHAKCNLRKNDELFPKNTVLYYLGLTNARLARIEKEIAKLNNIKKRGQILTRTHSALYTGVVDPKDIQKIIVEIERARWDEREIVLPQGIEFLDEVYNSFYANMDTTPLLDKVISSGGEVFNLELHKATGESLNVSTINSWRDAIEQGYAPVTTLEIKACSYFTFIEDLIEALSTAKMPKVSFISDPILQLCDLDWLSPKILEDPEGDLKRFIDRGISVGELINKGIVKKNDSYGYQIAVEFNGFETLLIEQFRADLNDDGIEDMFVRGWQRAVGGTLGYGFSIVLTRLSQRQLIEPADFHRKAVKA